MSQAGSNNNSGGTPPPTVATSYVTDSGTATPALNILNVNGAGGIVVSANPNGSNNVLITNTGSAFTWTDASGAFLAATLNGYFIIGTATATLPAVPLEGNTIKFIVDHASQVLTIQANAGQSIRIGNVINSSTGGTCASTLQGDAISLVYRSVGATWFAETGVQGSWTLS